MENLYRFAGLEFSIGLPDGKSLSGTRALDPFSVEEVKHPHRFSFIQVPQADPADRELTAEQWLAIAREARDCGMIFALLTGGEPLIRKDFFQIYRGMKELGLLICINSNGSLLCGDVLQQFLEDPPFRFNISLYGGSNETYRAMCGQPAYERVKENIRALRKAGVDVSLNLSITQYNRQDLPRIYRDALELDVNVRASSYMYPPIRINGGQSGCGNRLSCRDAAQASVQWDLLRFSPEEFSQRAEAMLALSADVKEGCPTEGDAGVQCRAGSTSFWMTWDGRMLPCGMMPYPDSRPLEVGFRQAWEQIRAQTARIRTPSACTTCQYQPVCSVCAATCVTETGRFDEAPAYVCEMTRQIVEATRQAVQEKN